METPEKTVEIKKYNINGNHIYIENISPDQGKIIIDCGYRTYSTYWGAMSGSSIYGFINRIDSHYFANRINPNNNYSPNWKRTFTNIRKIIRNEVCLPWYKHKEFQKEMRKNINEFELNCKSFDSINWFVDNVKYYLVDRMPFYNINDRYDSKQLENDFVSILCSEPWYMVVETESHEYKYLKKIHKEIKEYFEKNKLV